MHARYVFHVRFRLVAEAPDATVEDPTFETRVAIEAPEPGQPGWLFFRDTLWRGEVNDRRHVRNVLERKVGIPIESVTFRALYLDEAYREALEAEIASNLELFKADDVPEVLTKYLGSSIEVESDDE